MKTGEWHRVRKATPCGICGKPDWCCRGEKGWCCMRVESDRMVKNGGWFHPFETARAMEPPPPSRPASHEARMPDFSALMHGWRDATGAETLTEIARSLGVSERSLSWLGTAWAADWDAVAFPMFDATSPTINQPCGIRLRKRDGKKFAVTGSRSGIFIPYGAMTCMPMDRIFICEGPTDTAACLDLGLFALGRASCRGGEEFILSALSQLCPSETVVVSDNDGPGIAGADYLMGMIHGRKVKLTPPCKDMRTFIHAGGTAEVIHSMLKDLLRS
jgi:hypothetical protein